MNIVNRAKSWFSHFNLFGNIDLPKERTVEEALEHDNKMVEFDYIKVSINMKTDPNIPYEEAIEQPAYKKFLKEEK